MKQMISLLLSLVLATASLPALADEGNAGDVLSAFYSLTGQRATEQTGSAYLEAIMAGRYTASAENLPGLSSVTPREMAAYASANRLTVSQVRNRYYRALAETVKLAFDKHPALDTSAGAAQTVLYLFLEGDQARAGERQSIRMRMTEDSAEKMAELLGLPESFVTFVVMDEGWQDDSWENDDDWMLLYSWVDDDLTDDLTLGSRDSASSSRVADLQERLIALGYLTGKADGIFGERTLAALKEYQRANGLPATGAYDDTDDVWLYSGDAVARWDYSDAFDNTPDSTRDNTPDNTRDSTRDNTPDNTRDNTRDNT